MHGLCKSGPINAGGSHSVNLLYLRPSLEERKLRSSATSGHESEVGGHYQPLALLTSSDPTSVSNGRVIYPGIEQDDRFPFGQSAAVPSSSLSLMISHPNRSSDVVLVPDHDDDAEEEKLPIRRSNAVVDPVTKSISVSSINQLSLLESNDLGLDPSCAEQGLPGLSASMLPINSTSSLHEKTDAALSLPLSPSELKKLPPIPSEVRSPHPCTGRFIAETGISQSCPNMEPYYNESKKSWEAPIRTHLCSDQPCSLYTCHPCSIISHYDEKHFHCHEHVRSFTTFPCPRVSHHNFQNTCTK